MGYSSKLTKEQLNYNIVYHIRDLLKLEGVNYSVGLLSKMSDSIHKTLTQYEEVEARADEYCE